MKYILQCPQAIHEIGQRSNQEDSIFPVLGKADENTRLFIVCDGMGGHEKGEVASNTVCQALAEYITSRFPTDSVFTKDMFAEALEYAYQQLDKRDSGSFKKMGTTLTLLYMHRGGVFAAHIGDSRIYHIRPGKGLMYMSRDHSLAFDLFQCGEITYEEMLTYPQKNVITRAMQPGENRSKADMVNITDVKPGDYFYLCSDGMLEEMDNDTLFGIFNGKQSDEEKRQELCRMTVQNQDNHSAYIVHVESVVMEEGDDSLPNEEQTARCNALNIIPMQGSANGTKKGLPQENAEDDVTVVECGTETEELQAARQSQPTAAKPRKSQWRKYKWLAIIAAMLAVFALGAMVLNGKSDKGKKEKPVMMKPIKRG